MTSSMVSKIAISAALAVLTTCTTELVSDEKKKICGFSTIVWARIWFVTGPYVGMSIKFGQLLPQTSYCTLAMIGGLFLMMINGPRTIPQPKHSNLPTELRREIYTIKYENHKPKTIENI